MTIHARLTVIIYNRRIFYFYVRFTCTAVLSKHCSLFKRLLIFLNIKIRRWINVLTTRRSHSSSDYYYSIRI